MKLIRLLTIICIAAGLHATSANAQSILNNITGSYTLGTNLGLGTDAADRTKGVGLTMGAGLDYFFQNMQAIISNPDAVQRMLTGGIYSNVGGNPGTLLAAFNPIAVAAGTANASISLTTSAPFVLTAGVTYWFVLDGPSVANSLEWRATSPNTTPTASGGASFVGYRFSSNGGSTWTNSAIFNAMSINAAPVPEPSTWAMVAAGAGMLLALKRAGRRS